MSRSITLVSSDNLGALLLQLQQDGRLCDVELRAGSDSVRVHGCVVAAQCPALLAIASKERRIVEGGPTTLFPSVIDIGYSGIDFPHESVSYCATALHKLAALLYGQNVVLEAGERLPALRLATNLGFTAVVTQLQEEQYIVPTNTNPSHNSEMYTDQNDLDKTKPKKCQKIDSMCTSKHKTKQLAIHENLNQGTDEAKFVTDSYTEHKDPLQISDEKVKDSFKIKMVDCSIMNEEMNPNESYVISISDQANSILQVQVTSNESSSLSNSYAIGPSVALSNTVMATPAIDCGSEVDCLIELTLKDEENLSQSFISKENCSLDLNQISSGIEHHLSGNAIEQIPTSSHSNKSLLKVSNRAKKRNKRTLQPLHSKRTKLFHVHPSQSSPTDDQYPHGYSTTLSGHSDSSRSLSKSATASVPAGGLHCGCCGVYFRKCSDLVKHVLSLQHYSSTCPICSFQTGDRHAQLRHFSLHDSPLPFFCCGCDLRFRTRAHLAMHEPKHSSTKPFSCSECGRAFKWRHALQAHVLTHRSMGHLLCDVCGFSSNYITTFKAHLQQHTGKAFVCTHSGCSFKAFRKDNLKSHLVSHSNVRPHQCDVCGNSFSLARNLSRHMRLHYGARLRCDQVSKATCAFTTTRPDKLRCHLDKKHNMTPDGALKFSPSPSALGGGEQNEQKPPVHEDQESSLSVQGLLVQEQEAAPSVRDHRTKLCEPAGLEAGGSLQPSEGTAAGYESVVHQSGAAAGQVLAEASNGEGEESVFISDSGIKGKTASSTGEVVHEVFEPVLKPVSRSRRKPTLKPLNETMKIVTDVNFPVEQLKKIPARTAKKKLPVRKVNSRKAIVKPKRKIDTAGPSEHDPVNSTTVNKLKIPGKETVPSRKWVSAHALATSSLASSSSVSSSKCIQKEGIPATGTAPLVTYSVPRVTYPLALNSNATYIVSSSQAIAGLCSGSALSAASNANYTVSTLVSQADASAVGGSVAGAVVCLSSSGIDESAPNTSVSETIPETSAVGSAATMNSSSLVNDQDAVQSALGGYAGFMNLLSTSGEGVLNSDTSSVFVSLPLAGSNAGSSTSVPESTVSGTTLLTNAGSGPSTTLAVDQREKSSVAMPAVTTTRSSAELIPSSFASLVSYTCGSGASTRSCFSEPEDTVDVEHNPSSPPHIRTVKISDHSDLSATLQQILNKSKDLNDEAAPIIDNQHGGHFMSISYGESDVNTKMEGPLGAISIQGYGNTSLEEDARKSRITSHSDSNQLHTPPGPSPEPPPLSPSNSSSANLRFFDSIPVLTSSSDYHHPAVSTSCSSANSKLTGSSNKRVTIPLATPSTSKTNDSNERDLGDGGSELYKLPNVSSPGRVVVTSCNTSSSASGSCIPTNIEDISSLFNLSDMSVDVINQDDAEDDNSDSSVSSSSHLQLLQLQECQAELSPPHSQGAICILKPIAAGIGKSNRQRQAVLDIDSIIKTKAHVQRRRHMNAKLTVEDHAHISDEADRLAWEQRQGAVATRSLEQASKEERQDSTVELRDNVGSLKPLLEKIHCQKGPEKQCNITAPTMIRRVEPTIDNDPSSASCVSAGTCINSTTATSSNDTDGSSLGATAVRTQQGSLLKNETAVTVAADPVTEEEEGSASDQCCSLTLDACTLDSLVQSWTHMQ